MKSAATTINRAIHQEQSNLSRQTDFIALYDMYFARVYNYIRYRCFDADTADDLTAMIWEKALNNYHHYQPDRAPFSAWLFAIARNVVNGHLRSKKRIKSTSLEALPDLSASEYLPEADLISAETSSELIAAFITLDERERDLLSLKFAAHLTNRRIAELSGLTEANVGVIIFRSLKKLRAKLAS